MATAWNGVLILAPLRADSSDGAITSHVSGGWGCSAFHGPVPKSSSKFKNSHAAPLYITVKELLPIVIWGKKWLGFTIHLSRSYLSLHLLKAWLPNNLPQIHLLYRSICPTTYHLMPIRSLLYKHSRNLPTLPPYPPHTPRSFPTSLQPAYNQLFLS